MNYTW